MKCAEVRNLVLPYLDSELDARDCRAIELHLASCAECRLVYDAEQAFDEKLEKFCSPGDGDRAWWNKLESTLIAQAADDSRAAPASSTSSRVRKISKIGVAALLALVIGLAWFGTTLPIDDEPFDLALAVEHRHLAHATYLSDPGFASPPSADAIAKLDGRLDNRAFEVRPSDQSFSVLGSRLCKIGDVPVAFILGEKRQIPISIVVLQESELRHFPEMEKRFAAGHSIACSQIGEYEFGARIVAGQVVCVVGDLPRPELESMLASIPSTP